MSNKGNRDETNRKERVLNRRSILLGGSTLAAAAAALGTRAPVIVRPAQAQQPAPSGRRPNILVIFGDDIGQTNISAYSFGVMGYRTPNIDRIAREGMMFTDYYAEQSCTAGRSSFITGQATLRTGLSKVGLPGAPQGLQAKDATIADARICHWAIRQEPSRRPQRVSADRARLRRVPWQSLPPQRRGRAGAADLSA
jgi:arylsulfatase